MAGEEGHDVGLYYRLDREGYGYHKWSSIERVDERFVPRENAAEAPANQVTWLGALRYAQWLSERTGSTYRLPTEAEWEFAARGEEGRPWPWGMKGPSADSEVVRGERWRRKQWTGRPWPQYAVGHYTAGATPEGVLGLMGDTHGEWCVTKYVANPTPEQATDPAVDADAPDLEAERVKRGAYHRLAQRFPYGFPRTNNYRDGRVWTRTHAPPTGEGGNADTGPLAAVRLVRVR